MGKVAAQAIMSLDGYVAKQDNTIGPLFDWLQNGEVEIPTPAGDFAVHLSPPSAEHWRRWVPSLGALVCGRTLFDVAEGWHGRHTLDVPVVVVTHRVPTDWVDAHPEAPFTFVTDGVAAAVAHAQTLAGDRVVAVTGGTIAQQCLDMGLRSPHPDGATEGRPHSSDRAGAARYTVASVHEIGRRRRNQPAPRIILEALTDLDRPGARPWLELLHDEQLPLVLSTRAPSKVVWSSIWTKRPEAVIEFDLPSDGRSGTDLSWTLFVDDPAPDDASIAHMRKRRTRSSMLTFGTHSASSRLDWLSNRTRSSTGVRTDPSK